MKEGEKILDIGCCFGQEIRKLVCPLILTECPRKDFSP